MSDEMILHDNVMKGAEFLDENYPGWYRKIDIDNFDISNGEICICGQLFVDKINSQWVTGYHWASRNLRVTPEDNPDWMMDLGFCTDDSIKTISGVQWEILADCWINQIEKRLVEDGMMA